MGPVTSSWLPTVVTVARYKPTGRASRLVTRLVTVARLEPTGATRKPVAGEAIVVRLSQLVWRKVVTGRAPSLGVVR